MATVVNTLFPPMVDTFMNAFPNTQDAVVYFSLSPFNSAKDIKHVHISLTNQLNNENALKADSGVLFSKLLFDKNVGLYYVTIPRTELKAGEAFNINQFYKVQLRFDSCDWTMLDPSVVPGMDIENGVLISSQQKVGNYLLSYQQYFSEWSTVCLIRPILQPKLVVKTFDNKSIDGPQVFNRGIIPIVGYMSFGDGSSNVETETMQSYKIRILDQTSKIEYMASPTIYTGDNVDPNVINYKIDLQTLNADNTEYFICEIIAMTKNQYRCSYTAKFKLDDYLEGDETEKFKPVFDIQMDNENGIAKVKITNKNVQTFFGTMHIKRSSSLDNFKTVEDIYTKKIAGSLNIEFEDNTVSSLVWYRYSAQFENSAGGFTPVKYSSVFLPEFYDAILSRGKTQYSIRYNYSVSNLKPVVNRAKVDTLGGKYPKFAENAILNYKQFSIKGLISAEADVYQKFLEKKKVYKDNLANYYEAYKEQHEEIKDLARNDMSDWIIDNPMGYPATDIIEDTNKRFLTTTQNDWMWEREFREELVKWLNDGEPKLYRSMAEGSMVVMLTDVSITPMQSTSRRMWDFTATVYEIAEADSLEKLDALGIYNVVTPDEERQEGPQKPDEDFIQVIKVGQLYKHVVQEKEDIRNIILQNLLTTYGAVGSDSDGNTIYDPTNVLSTRKPSDLYLKNVKIFFHSQPNLYTVDSQGRPQWIYDNKFNSTDPKEYSKVQLGYSFDIMTSSSDGYSTILVNDKGYYQVPNELDVKSLSFNSINDVVTIEYTLVYKENNNMSQTVSGSTIAKTVIGQYEDSFYPNHYMGAKIRNKYNYVGKAKDGSTYMEKMQYWKGICLDTVPYSMWNIQYAGEDSGQVYEVGHTGVLHLLKNFKIKDIKLVGRRMVRKPIERQPYLEDWEYVLDSSVSDEALGKQLNWFTLGKIDTGQLVEIHPDNSTKIDSIIPSWNIIQDTNRQSTRNSYHSELEINHPKRNTVYNIQGKLRIFYHDNWYDFQTIVKEETNLTPNTSLEEIGLVRAPVDGQINYYGSVVRSSY